MSNRPGPPSRPSSRRQPSRPKLKNQLLFVFGILILAAGAFYTALVVATQVDQIFFPDSDLALPTGLSKLPGIDKADSGELGGGRINILVMGLDRRPRDGNAPARTDTMFVMTIDPSTRTSRGLAMPRDLWVDIPTKGGGSFKERINTAYIYGENSNYPGGGPALGKQTVEKLLGIKLNYYVIIDFEGFKQLIDLLGGIDVDVPSPGVNDPFYSETEAPGDYYPCIFKAGVHHMNGSDALCYARTRRNSSDLDRIKRQQRIIFAALDKASELRLLADPTNLVNLWKRYKNTVQTDISDLQIPGFAKLAAGMDSERLAFLTLEPAVTPADIGGASVLVPSEAGIKVIVNGLFSDYRIEQEAALVEVQNGTDKPGLAQKVVDYLINLGIAKELLKPANASDSAHVRTEIVDFNSKRYTAERIATWLGLPKDRVRSPGVEDAAIRTNAQADIVVIVGSDVKVEPNALAGP